MHTIATRATGNVDLATAMLMLVSRSSLPHHCHHPLTCQQPNRYIYHSCRHVRPQTRHDHRARHNIHRRRGQRYYSGNVVGSQVVGLATGRISAITPMIPVIGLVTVFEKLSNVGLSTNDLGLRTTGHTSAATLKQPEISSSATLKSLVSVDEIANLRF